MTQRKIEFRAWAGPDGEKVMSEPFGLREAHFVLNPFWDEPVMQFTGLKDKNGKEIYEGDIVESFHYRRGIVEYHANSQTGKAGWTARDPKVTEGPYNVDMMGCFVIGNIYDNPDLLQ